MTDPEPTKAKRPSSARDFDTVKLVATELEQKRITGNREKSKILKAARLHKLENQ
ncbi:hypothetical protein [Rhizobium sp. Leaf262]|jgi:hypothetical protein|uniref:hypothetical protein n=1 Tax=Rhizobium sp. Leaf262 TaxID=1736312 RepID=UPI000ADD10FF|nr:hypothetical protein [Rhizobium sp. Leaf262]